MATDSRSAGGVVMETQNPGLPPQKVAYCLKYDTNPAHHSFLQEIEDMVTNQSLQALARQFSLEKWREGAVEAIAVHANSGGAR